MYAVAVAADGARAVSGGADGTVRVWDLSTGHEQASLAGHTGSVYAVAVAADGARAVSGGADGTVRVWDLSTGHEQASLAGHTGSVYAVAVAADGARAVSGGADGTVRVWDLSTGHEQASLAGHTGWVNAVAVTADGARAVSGDQRTVRIRDLSTAHEQSKPVGRTERSHPESRIRIGRESGEFIPRESLEIRLDSPPRLSPQRRRRSESPETTASPSAEDPVGKRKPSRTSSANRQYNIVGSRIGAVARNAAVSGSAFGWSHAGNSGPAVPLGERTDPLPHDGLFIRRNNAFGTKSTIGITDLIEQGVLIDQERIRFDDFVAARSDEVPPPAAGEAVGVSCGLARTVADCRASQQTTHFLEIALRAADSAGASTAPPAPLPVNFVFVVDTSASMSGGKLANAKEAIRGLYDQLKDDDIIGIVSFDTTARTVLKTKRKADLPPAEFISIVEGLTAGGGTDLNLGIRYGIHEINRNAAGQSGIVNCVYLFSDGDPTSGETNWIQIRSNIAAELRGDLTLSCFGFGADARMRELEALAGLTGGHCTLVSRPDEVRLNLTADLARREHLAAVNIQLKIDISQDVGIWHLYGHDLVTDPATRAAVLRDAAGAREQGEKQFGAASMPDLITEEKGIRIFAPDLAFGETYWIVLELAIPDGVDTGGLGTASVQYVDALAREARRHEIALGAPGQIPEAVVAGHAIGLWTSEVTFYALDDLYEDDRATPKERLTRHIKILRAASQYVPAPWLTDDQVVLAKLISLTDNLQRPRAWDDSLAGSAAPMQFTMHTMNTLGRVRGGYVRRYF